jgi:uncharacterized protein (TIGR03435 family)
MRMVVLALALAGASSAGQPPPLVGAQFDVVSIKRNTSGERGGGGRSLPDGTQMFTNRTVASFVAVAAPEPVFEVVGLPDWAKTDRYDVVAKPALDSHPTRDDRRDMLRNMMIERFSLVSHVEERQRDGFALVVARGGGRLGPQLKPSALDCAGADRARCGGRFGGAGIELTGGRLDELASSIEGIVEGPIMNRTGLDGFYDLTLRFSMQPLNAAPTAPLDDPPSIFTALQEQLGLKLVREKIKVKVFVIDHIERPTPD